MESINYTPALPSVKPAAYNKVIVTWKHGFQHSFVTVGHTLKGQLKAVEELEYVKEVIHYEITKEEYESFYSASLDEVEAPEKNAEHKKSRSKKGLPAFSSLENFFGGENTVEKKSTRRKK